MKYLQNKSVIDMRKTIDSCYHSHAVSVLGSSTADEQWQLSSDLWRLDPMRPERPFQSLSQALMSLHPTEALLDPEGEPVQWAIRSSERLGQSRTSQRRGERHTFLAS